MVGRGGGGGGGGAELAIKAVESRLLRAPEIFPSVRRQSSVSKGEW